MPDLDKVERLSLFERYSTEWDGFPARPPGWRFGAPDTTSDWRMFHAR